MKYYAYRELKALSTTAFMLAFIYKHDNYNFSELDTYALVNLEPYFTPSFGEQYERVWVLETEHDSWLEIENGLHSIAFSFVSCNPPCLKRWRLVHLPTIPSA